MSGRAQERATKRRVARTAKGAASRAATRATTHTAKPTAKRASERRVFIRRGVVGLATLGVAFRGSADTAEDTELPAAPDTRLEPGQPFTNYGMPVDERNDVIRWISANPAVPGNGVSWSPLHALEGTITPNGLHFERHHNGVPLLQADTWSLFIDGLVDKPLRFDLDALHRYRLQSLTCFIECGGNSNSLWHPNPVQAPAGYLHGLVSAAEWTGLALSRLIEEAGPLPNARWLIAEGYDSAGVSVSIPLDKALDDTLLALYQNGEPMRREQGYPARLVVPGWEGITQIKWLRRLHLADQPAMSRFDTVSYTDLQADGTAKRFSFPIDVKSVITTPSPGDQLVNSGLVEVSGLAWSGRGRIRQVEISADGGRRWHKATLDAGAAPQGLTRFRFSWRWQGGPAILQSRATDLAGRVQPTREALLAREGGNAYYHYHAINSWAIDRQGRVTHVYA